MLKGICSSSTNKLRFKIMALTYSQSLSLPKSKDKYFATAGYRLIYNSVRYKALYSDNLCNFLAYEIGDKNDKIPEMWIHQHVFVCFTLWVLNNAEKYLLFLLWKCKCAVGWKSSWTKKKRGILVLCVINNYSHQLSELYFLFVTCWVELWR